jgi:hypothetical protein
MPLVKLFARHNLTKAVPLASLQSKLCEIWKTKPDTTKLMLFRCEDWTDESFQEDIYVDIRAYGACEHSFVRLHFCMDVDGCENPLRQPILRVVLEAAAWYSLFPILHFPFFFYCNTPGKAERTREMVLDGMKGVQQAFQDHGLIANVRLETYEGERYLHLPPTK